jgi:3-hydroxyacyl-[acyl-carrier-protein] dehydratase
MIVEALAQASGILVSVTLNRHADDGVVYVLAGIDKVRFKRQVIPGDRLQLDAAIVSRTLGVFKLNCTASVDGELACTTNIIICADKKHNKLQRENKSVELESAF